MITNSSNGIFQTLCRGFHCNHASLLTNLKIYFQSLFLPLILFLLWLLIPIGLNQDHTHCGCQHISDHNQSHPNTSSYYSSSSSSLYSSSSSLYSSLYSSSSSSISHLASISLLSAPPNASAASPCPLCPASFPMILLWYAVYVFLGLFCTLLLLDILQPGCPRAYILITVAIVVPSQIALALPLHFQPSATAHVFYLLVPFLLSFIATALCYALYVWHWASDRQALRVKRSLSDLVALRFASDSFEPQIVTSIDPSHARMSTNSTSSGTFGGVSSPFRRDPNLRLPARPSLDHFVESVDACDTGLAASLDRTEVTIALPYGAARHGDSDEEVEGDDDDDEDGNARHNMGDEPMSLFAQERRRFPYPVAQHTEDRVNWWVLHDDIPEQETSPATRMASGAAFQAIAPETLRRFKAIRRLVRTSWSLRLAKFAYGIRAETQGTDGERAYLLLGQSAKDWTLFDQDFSPESVQLSFKVIADFLLFKIGILGAWACIQVYMTYVVRPLPPSFWLFMAAAVGFLLLRVVVMAVLVGLNNRLPHWPEIRFFAMFAGQMYFELAYRSFFIFAGNWNIIFGLSGLTFLVTVFQYGFQMSNFWYNLFQVGCRRSPFCKYTQFCFLDPDRKGHILTYNTHIANKSVRYYWANISKIFSLVAFILMFAILHYTPWLNHFYPTLALPADRVSSTFYTYLFAGGVEFVTDLFIQLLTRFYLKVDMSFHAIVATILDTRTRFLFAVSLLLMYMDTPVSLIRFTL